MKQFKDLHIVNCDDRQKAVQHIIDKWQSKDSRAIVNFIYYSNFILMHKDVEYLDSMLLSDHILIDGIGMQLYMKVVKNLWPFNLNGTDLNPVLLRELDARQIPVAFYGTTDENINQAVINISAYLPNDSIYYSQNGFSPLDWDAIRDGSALLIGMGSPRQENWVRVHWDIITKKKLLVVTVGGFFDFASGFYVRAPNLVRKFKLEWAWRTMLHPGRHLKKRLNDLTILYKPFVDRINGSGRDIEIKELSN